MKPSITKQLPVKLPSAFIAAYKRRAKQLKITLAELTRRQLNKSLTADVRKSLPNVRGVGRPKK
ncbi:MAG TPA: hypothetical protein VMX74_01180 [Pirellulales bacterium]|nr:hypothetical protein [Pirellulales bacterium]